MERIRSHLPPSASSHSSPTHSVSLDRKQHTFPMEIYERSGMQYEVPRTSRDNRDDERDDPALKMRREERYQWQRHDLINPPVSTPKDSPIIRLPIVTHHHSANRRPSDMVSWRRGNTTWYNSTGQERIGARFGHVNVGGRIQPVGMVPLAQEEASTAKQHRAKTYSQYTLTSTPTTSRNGSSDHTSLWSHRYQPPPTLSHRQRTSSSRGRGNHQSVSPPLLSSRVIIPSNIVIPSALSPQSSSGTESPVETPEDSQGKRSTTDSWKSSPSPTPSLKRQKTNFGSQDTGFDKLDLLCAATLDLGPLSENPAGCSCPKSKCVALYCDCFKAGRRCSPTACTCLNCKNTVEESGANGARSKVRLLCFVVYSTFALPLLSHIIILRTNHGRCVIVIQRRSTRSWRVIQGRLQMLEMATLPISSNLASRHAIVFDPNA